MVLLVLLISITLLAIHIRLAPRKYLVHAARAGDFPDGRKPSKKVSTPRLFRVDGGEGFSRKGRFYGEALGNSMERYGIMNGTEFFGDYLSKGANLEERLSLLHKGDIVVVDDVAEYSKTGKRLRKINEISNDGTLIFCDDNLGEPHTKRSISKVIAVVTHIST